MKRLWPWLALLIASLAGAADAAPAQLAYELTEGQNTNAFVRDGKTAAHMLLRNGTDPRILVAFPAGNSGVAVWFEPTAKPVTWRLEAPPQPAEIADAKGRSLYGIQAIATVAAPSLTIKKPVLSNVRFLREYQATGRFPDSVAACTLIEGSRILFARDRVDGAPGYLLALHVLEGRIEGRSIFPGPGGTIRMMIVAASADTPLTGLGEDELLNDSAADDPAARNALRFLAYNEKFLAGSWRFNTYFGRDTLMSVQLLMPVLQHQAIEAGLDAVLARLNKAGEVAHEEGLAEFALVERARAGNRGGEPILDYAMVDDNLMLAPVAASFVLDHADLATARAWLASTIADQTRPGSTVTVGDALVRNFRFVAAEAAPFARSGRWQDLVAIKDGRLAGQWRDSDDGIGGGRYPYDVNAVLMPAALSAIGRMQDAGLLDPFMSQADRTALRGVDGLAATWRASAAGLFALSYSARTAAPAIRGYARSLGVPAEPALAALGSEALEFYGIALDPEGRPVPVMHSDEGFELFFGNPAPATLDRIVRALMRPFPAGLMTDIGLLVANPVMSGAQAQARFTPAAYHGAVVWSWQQALFAAGLERQLARTDLLAPTRDNLVAAQARLWRAILSTREIANSELWSWTLRDGRYVVVPFGAGQKDADESNAAQLWSTVYLAVKPPASLASYPE